MAERIEVDCQVICINERYNVWIDKFGNRWPLYRQVYTVREIFEAESPAGIIALHLEEIINEARPTMPIGKPFEIGFKIEHFRPVKRTSIEIFTEMIQRTPEFAR